MGTNLSISPQRFVILYLQQSKFKSMGKGTNFSGQAGTKSANKIDGQAKN